MGVNLTPMGVSGDFENMPILFAIVENLKTKSFPGIQELARARYGLLRVSGVNGG